MGGRHDTARLHTWTAKELTRLLIDSVRDYAIFMLDPDGVIMSWNPGAQRLKGYQAEEVVGKHFSVLYPPDAGVEVRCADQLRQAAENERHEEEGWRQRKDGTRFWASVVLSPVRGESGELLGFAKVTRDLTERRAAEQERIRRVRAEEAVRLRDVFLSIASHELKTPLSGLLLDLQMLSALVESQPDASTKLARALRSTRRLTALVNALLDVSRISAGQLTLSRERFDLAVAARDIIDEFREEFSRDGVEIAADLRSEVVGEWDRLRVEQILSNLLSNALRYADGTAICVELSKRDGCAVVEVKDGGPGFPEGDLDRVFDRFERAASPLHHGGMGLGLYVVREIAEAHGGTVRARNRPDGGAAVTVRLPLAPRKESPNEL